jgi:hypothetical protein
MISETGSRYRAFRKELPALPPIPVDRARGLNAGERGGRSRPFRIRAGSGQVESRRPAHRGYGSGLWFGTVKTSVCPNGGPGVFRPSVHMGYSMALFTASRPL